MSQTTSFDTLRFDHPQIWREVVKAMGELEALVWSDPMVTDDLTRAEGVRQLTRIIAGAFPVTMELVDPRYPQFLQLLSTRVQWGLPSADCHYLWAPVHGDHTYRVVGDRGTARVIDLEVRHSHIARLGEWKLFERLTELEVGPHNQVEVVISRERPAGAVNWLKLPEGPANLVFRQYFYDWDTEQAARLTIITEGVKYPPPPLTTDDIRRNLERFCDFLKHTPAGFRRTVEAYYQAPEEALSFDGIDYAFASIKYGKGRYRCGPGEALILETRLPRTPFWNIQIGSHFWEARDFHLRQNSLNGHQAYVDEQGVFRAVISHEDPGIANWLDAGGHEQGLITIRYYDADSTPPATLRKVKLADVASTLPASTPRITPEARQKTLRARAWSMPRLGRD